MQNNISDSTYPELGTCVFAAVGHRAPTTLRQQNGCEQLPRPSIERCLNLCRTIQLLDGPPHARSEPRHTRSPPVELERFGGIGQIE